jgi:glycosyltransferase involved in cell wall biosynthesis
MQKFNSKFDVSVIIPTYDRSKLLNYTLLSLLQQDIDKDRFEVIVADDGSSDNTREIAAQYAKLMNVKYVYQADKGYRPASARNMGVRAAEGHICMFIDSGILLNANCVGEHIDYYTGLDDQIAVVGYVYGFERTKDSEKKLMELIDPANAAEAIVKVSKEEIYFDIRDEHYIRYNDQIQDLPAPWYYFWTCHVSVPRAELIAAGLFDSKYDGRWGMEDNDLAFRLVQQGIKIHFLRSAQAIHYPHDKNKAERRAEGYHNCEYFNAKYGTLETQLFLDCYLDVSEFTDINRISIEMSKAKTRMTNDEVAA